MQDMNKEEYREKLQDYIEENQVEVELAERFERLQDNEDFKVLFTEGLFRDHAASLVLQSNDPRLAKDEHELIIAEIKGLSSVHQYLAAVHMRGANAADKIRNARDTIDELNNQE
tara:strand:- start:428 stop:772 length:345 start_codon:yes stop_codon:yes gene_type:complete